MSARCMDWPPFPDVCNVPFLMLGGEYTGVYVICLSSYVSLTYTLIYMTYFTKSLRVGSAPTVA